MKNEMFEAWQQAINYLENVIPEGDFDTWIRPILYSHHDDTAVYLSVPNAFIKNWLENHYMISLITGALSNASGHNVTTNIIVKNDEELLSTDDNYQSTSYQLNPKYTFDLFIRALGNMFAHDAAKAVANNLSNTYNPLYIRSKTGLGKSHLLNAIGHTIHENAPELNVCYCSAEKFMIEMVSHLRRKKMDTFRNKYRNVDVLLVDDIHFLSGKTGTQEEFFHTFNALYDARKQIVITSNRLSTLDERLCSRLEGGLVVKITRPDLETKNTILNRIAERLKVKIPNEVIKFITSSKTGDIRKLEGMLMRLGAFSSMNGVPIDLKMAKKALKDVRKH